MEDHLLLYERVGLLLKEVHLIYVAGLYLVKVLLEVADVFNNLL